ncbi:MAG: DUF1214 domain-containing protein [Caulobacteraceae bacterium]|nr:DUF1214 domain-containing protein [Caulobacteraceae bacterium]
MSFGAGPDDEALKAAWEDFCDRLRAAGDGVFKDANPATSLQRADGFRFLTQNLSQAFGLALETKDAAYPAFHAFCGPARKLGSDNADAVYLQAWIDGRFVYRISGDKGSARFWNLTIQGHRPDGALHEPFGDTPQANLFGHQLNTDWDGGFELYVGGAPQGRNWLPTTPESRKIFFRQFFDSWDEEPARIRIERVGMDTPRPIPTPAAMIEAMAWAGRFVGDVVSYWPDFIWGKGQLIDPESRNRFNAANLAASAASAEAGVEDAKRGRFLTQMRWSLQPDEALIIEFDDPRSFWMLTNEAVFGNSLDYLYRHVSFTPSRTLVDADGRIRLVMTHKDPGYANWIETQGYRAGVLTYRNMELMAAPSFHTSTVRVDELGQRLRDSISTDERAEAMRRRFRANLRRHALT